MIKSLLDVLVPLIQVSVSSSLIFNYLIIILSITWALGVFAYTEASGVKKFIHPERSAELSLQKELASFKHDYENIYSKYPIKPLEQEDAEYLSHVSLAS